VIDATIHLRRQPARHRAESSAGPAPRETDAEPSGGPVVIRAEVVGDGLRLRWPEALADWAMLLAPDDLPERFHLRQGVEVVDSTRFLASLRRDIGRGPAGPRARYGALQRDILNLHSALLGGRRPHGINVKRPFD